MTNNLRLKSVVSTGAFRYFNWNFYTTSKVVKAIRNNNHEQNVFQKRLMFDRMARQL